MVVRIELEADAIAQRGRFSRHQHGRDHVEPLFKEYGVRLIRPGDADAFAEEVEASAH